MGGNPNLCSAVSYFSTLLGSIIGAGRLSFRVRDGTGRFPAAMAAVTLFTLFWASHCVSWEIFGVLVVECVKPLCGFLVFQVWVWLRARLMVRQSLLHVDLVDRFPPGWVCVSFRPVSASSLNLLLGV